MRSFQSIRVPQSLSHKADISRGSMFCIPSFDEMTNLTPYFNHVIPAYPGIQTVSHSASQVEEISETGSSVPLIPRSVLFGNPDKATPRLSPDGARLAYLAPSDGVLNVWVGPTADPGSAVPVTSDTGRGIRM